MSHSGLRPLAAAAAALGTGQPLAAALWTGAARLLADGELCGLATSGRGS